MASDRKEYHKKYREIHKKQMEEYYKEYREIHKEHIKEYTKKYQKKYHEDHKEQRKEYHKEYHEDHKEQIEEYTKKYGKEQIINLADSYIARSIGIKTDVLRKYPEFIESKREELKVKRLLKTRKNGKQESTKTS